jgi:hypothetical protein
LRQSEGIRAPAVGRCLHPWAYAPHDACSSPRRVHDRTHT